jgi:hypothetical protein
MSQVALTHFSGKLFFAPIDEQPRRIIDLGTGVGDWAIDGTSDDIPDASSNVHHNKQGTSI